MTEPVRVVTIAVAELEQLVEAAVRRALDARSSTTPTATSGGDWLDAGDVARELGVHRRTVAKLAKRGELPSAPVGRLLRFRRADVEALAGRRGQSPLASRR